MMRRLSIAILLSLGLNTAVWATAPDLLSPVGMQVDPGAQITATGLDFLDHPQSGSVNFSPQNYDIHLPGGAVLPVEDVIPYFGVHQSISTCKDFAWMSIDSVKPSVNLVTQYLIPKILGFSINAADLTETYNKLLGICNMLPPDQQAALFKTSPAYQIVSDIRNTISGSTEITFSGKTEAPYLGGFPIVPVGFAGTVVGQNGTEGQDIWSDGVVVASYEPILNSTVFQTPAFNSSLAYYRFLPNAAQQPALELASYNSAWLDKLVYNKTTGQVTNPCFQLAANPADPNNPAELKPYLNLVAQGCVGEHWPVGVTGVNFFNHANDKFKDLVVVSRVQMGDPKDASARIGYLTIYKHTEKVPTASSLFQDVWQFEKSVTPNKIGIPEPYGIAVIKDKVPGGGVKESVVVSSNRAIGKKYSIYHYAAGWVAPLPIDAGCAFASGLCANSTIYGPYKIYSADMNADGCGDILLTRAQIQVANNTPKIFFAPYFEVYSQQQAADKSCTGNFAAAVKYEVPAVAATPPPQISSLAIADFNKDGLLDVMAGDFRTYTNNGIPSHLNYVHFLENTNGLLNTLKGLPKFVVNTQAHGPELGVIDVKADAYANVGVVIGEPTKFVPVQPAVSAIESPCQDPAIAGKLFYCKCDRDNDKDGFFDLNLNQGKNNVVSITNCGVAVQFNVDNTPVILTDCATGNTITKTGRAWVLEWAKATDGKSCDNCSNISQDVCMAPEGGGPAGLNCFNPSQTDSDDDGYGDTCDAQINDDTQSALPQIREDRVIALDDGAAIARTDDLELVDAAVPAPTGNEVTILLNKTNIKGTPPPQCANADLNCICQLNPGLQACKCLKEPNAPECLPISISQPSCCLDVCRGDLTAPFPAMCDFIRPFNDQIRKITGLCMDVLVPAEGTQYHLSCTMPNTPAVDLGGGKAYVQVFKNGQIPKNYFKDWHKPVASENVLAQPVLLNPPSEEISANVNFNVTNLPAPNFDFSALQVVVPDATLTQTAGIAQIDGIMQIETYLSDVNAAVGAPVGKAAAGAGQKELLLDIKGFSSPPGCQWGGDNCPSPMPNTPPPQAFVDAIQAKVTEYEAAGKAVTIDTINDAFKSMDVGPAFMHQQILLAGNQGITSIPVQNTMGAIGVEGGCGCTMSSQSNIRNTIIPLIMAGIALAALAFFRRSIPKKD